MMSRSDLVIKGYEHPDTVNESQKNNIYKTYNPENTKGYGTPQPVGYATFTPEKICECFQYDENGNVIHSFNCKGTVTKKKYNFIEKFEDEKKENKLGELCPLCNIPPKYDCDCEYSDSICENNHIWYIEGDKIIVEDPHK